MFPEAGNTFPSYFCSLRDIILYVLNPKTVKVRLQD